MLNAIFWPVFVACMWSQSLFLFMSHILVVIRQKVLEHGVCLNIANYIKTWWSINPFFMSRLSDNLKRYFWKLQGDPPITFIERSIQTWKSGSFWCCRKSCLCAHQLGEWNLPHWTHVSMKYFKGYRRRILVFDIRSIGVIWFSDLIGKTITTFLLGRLLRCMSARSQVVRGVNQKSCH